MNPGMVGGIVGGSFGLLGGAIGTYFSIKNTSGPRERAFMIRVAVATWIGVSLFLVGLILLPRPYNFLLWLPYSVALPVTILWCNRRQQAIRGEEAAAKAPLASDPARPVG